MGEETKHTVLIATGSLSIPVIVNEFWTSKQRAAHSLHEVSYRACFKPKLPRFFIERLTSPGEIVYDPFMGRGTTLLEAALLGSPAPYLEAFMRLEIPDDMQEGFGYPQITREDKELILGKNFARLMKIDVQAKLRELEAVDA